MSLDGMPQSGTTEVPETERGGTGLEGPVISPLPWRVLEHRYLFDHVLIDPDPGLNLPPGRILLAQGERWLKQHAPLDLDITVASRYPEKLPSVWFENSLKVRFRPPDQEELREITNIQDLRLEYCCLDPEIAENTSLETLEGFVKAMGHVFRGPPRALVFWQQSDKILSSTTSTQVSCFEYLTREVSRRLTTRYWLEAYKTVYKARERLLKGKSSGVKVKTSMIRFYAYAKAANEHG